ncbi:Uncharacterized protein TPAR_01571 [Tolypocladium paradoxum]|uniref:Uncharacterized protein n=1 Tax=Tolypocladium paradoxum TaxID=94208 RepID=A0A2S4L738_9HYPO|nr:Uncharacterized protein TPAR_01571 [Tolypocladium paradoxum]
MAPQNSPQDIPGSSEVWETSVVDVHGSVNPSQLKIGDIGGKKQLGSASKLDYPDWLLLKVLWKVAPRFLQFGEIFGIESGELEEKYRNRLSGEDWWKALEKNDTTLRNWGHMAAWKHSADDILRRAPIVTEMLKQEGSAYAADNPFEIVVDASHRPRRKVAAQQYYEPSSEGESSRGTSPPQGSPPLGSPPQGPPPQGSPANAGSETRSGYIPSPVFGSGSFKLGTKAGPGSDGSYAPPVGPSRWHPDEAIINMSTILLLQGISLSSNAMSAAEDYDWTILHKQFKVTQPDTDESGTTSRFPVISARTDGCLQHIPKGKLPEHSRTLAILEVKPYKRASKAPAIRMQEGAEMAAWISTEHAFGLLPAPGKKYRRLLISQDLDEIYITLAEYDHAYVKYIQGSLDALDATRGPESTPSKSPRGPESGSKSARGAESTPSKSARGPDSPKSARGVESSKSARGAESSKSARGPESTSKSTRREEAGRQVRSSRTADQSSTIAIPERSRQQQQPPRSFEAAPRTPSGSPPTAGTPSAPLREREPNAAVGGETGGFLIMHEFEPYKIDNSDKMKELSVLLLALTDYLCKKDGISHLSQG